MTIGLEASRHSFLPCLNNDGEEDGTLLWAPWCIFISVSPKYNQQGHRSGVGATCLHPQGLEFGGNVDQSRCRPPFPTSRSDSWKDKHEFYSSCSRNVRKKKECGTECGELLSGSLCIIWAILNVNIAEAISYGKISSKGKVIYAHPVGLETDPYISNDTTSTAQVLPRLPHIGMRVLLCIPSRMMFIVNSYL